jgi:hypothetical protein
MKETECSDVVEKKLFCYCMQIDGSSQNNGEKFNMQDSCVFFKQNIQQNVMTRSRAAK